MQICMILRRKSRGVHSPWGHDAFPPPVSDFPLFRQIFRLCWKLSKFYLFPKNFSIFICQNFWWLFLRISTLFSLFQYISPLFRENYYFPLLWKIPLCFWKIHLLFTYFVCISFPPYFDHDAFMHHPMHVLDAPAQKHTMQNWTLHVDPAQGWTWVPYMPQ